MNFDGDITKVPHTYDLSNGLKELGVANGSVTP
jgi:hypothetical protein